MKLIKIERQHKSSDIGKHLITMVSKVMEIKPKVIVELGVRGGVSTTYLSLASKLLDSKLISVDKGECKDSCNWDKWEFIQSDSVEAGKNFKGKVDVLFIDTYHSKPQVMNELKAWMPKMNNDCLLMFHDTNPQWPKNVKIASEVGSVLDGINEFFGFRLNKNGCYDTVLYDDDYIYCITHKDYFEGMTYIRRIKK